MSFSCCGVQHWSQLPAASTTKSRISNKSTSQMSTKALHKRQKLTISFSCVKARGKATRAEHDNVSRCFICCGVHSQLPAVRQNSIHTTETVPRVSAATDHNIQLLYNALLLPNDCSQTVSTTPGHEHTLTVRLTARQDSGQQATMDNKAAHHCLKVRATRQGNKTRQQDRAQVKATRQGNKIRGRLQQCKHKGSKDTEQTRLGSPHSMAKLYVGASSDSRIKAASIQIQKTQAARQKAKTTRQVEVDRKASFKGSKAGRQKSTARQRCLTS